MGANVLKEVQTSVRQCFQVRIDTTTLYQSCMSNIVVPNKTRIIAEQDTVIIVT